MLKEKMTELRERLIAQANLVEKMLHSCRRGLMTGEAAPLREIVSVDEPEVNRMEILIDELCLTMLALYHPEAKDLRLTMMISKMTSDLERMADGAVNIAESALKVVPRSLLGRADDIAAMAEETIRMVKDGITSFIHEDSSLARDVCRRDAAVDALRDKIWKELAKVMAAADDPAAIESALHILRIANNFEKIADVSTNIAEETVFIARGFVIKHHQDDAPDSPSGEEPA